VKKGQNELRLCREALEKRSVDGLVIGIARVERAIREATSYQEQRLFELGARVKEQKSEYGRRGGKARKAKKAAEREKIRQRAIQIGEEHFARFRKKITKAKLIERLAPESGKSEETIRKILSHSRPT